MQEFSFPNTILLGNDAIEELARRMRSRELKRPLIVTDPGVASLDLHSPVLKALTNQGLSCVLYKDVHPNPIEQDVLDGAWIYRNENCDSIVAIGGGSPIDTAKVIKIAATHPGPLEVYDDAKGGAEKIRLPLPPLFAVPTTAGTGSEVGRSGVIILKKTNEKTIFFHPELLPEIAVLAPEMTAGLPPELTVATGIDAFTHCLEAYLSPSFHPMADGIALEGIRLVLESLPRAYRDGRDLQARARMQMAAAMGATAFQKGLGMIHSLAHPLSSECGIHHGLANALMLPCSIEFLEKSDLNQAQRERLERVRTLLGEFGYSEETLSESCHAFLTSLNINAGLKNHGVRKDLLLLLSEIAVRDSCHLGNMIPVSREDLHSVYECAYGEHRI